jgi:hypothetical protein
VYIWQDCLDRKSAHCKSLPTHDYQPTQSCRGNADCEFSFHTRKTVHALHTATIMNGVSALIIVPKMYHTSVSWEMELRSRWIGLQRNRGLISGRSKRLLPTACSPPLGPTKPSYSVDIWGRFPEYSGRGVQLITHFHTLLRCGVVPPCPTHAVKAYPGIILHLLYIYRCSPISASNRFQYLPRLRETADNTERYIHV